MIHLQANLKPDSNEQMRLENYVKAKYYWTTRVFFCKVVVKHSEQLSRHSDF
jgi:hypothetical protein